VTGHAIVYRRSHAWRQAWADIGAESG